MTFFILFKIWPFSLSINVIEKGQIFFFYAFILIKKIEKQNTTQAREAVTQHRE